MFALDAFEEGATLSQQLTRFLMHLVPSYFLIAFLLIAWKWEKIGGAIFMIIGLAFAPFIFILNHHRNHFSVANSLLVVLLINMPFVLVGALFWLSAYKKRTLRQR
jgi:hypothetical protein